MRMCSLHWLKHLWLQYGEHRQICISYHHPRHIQRRSTTRGSSWPARATTNNSWMFVTRESKHLFLLNNLMEKSVLTEMPNNWFHQYSVDGLHVLRCDFFVLAMPLFRNHTVLMLSQFIWGGYPFCSSICHFGCSFCGWWAAQWCIEEQLRRFINGDILQRTLTQKAPCWHPSRMWLKWAACWLFISRLIAAPHGVAWQQWKGTVTGFR